MEIEDLLKMLKEPWNGHDLGAKKVEQLFDWCEELNINELTLYVFLHAEF